jgi:hypothetical protein
LASRARVRQSRDRARWLDVIASPAAAMVQAAEVAVADILSGDAKDPATYDRAATAARKVREIVSHVAANRFVFLLDRFHIPTTYYQAATPENVDLFPPPATPAAPEGRAPAPDGGL